MDLVELLTVKDHFALSGRGLVVIPDFPLPNGQWKGLSAQVVVVRPDGSELKVNAQIEPSHFNIRDPDVSAAKRWRVVVSLQGVTKDGVPIGSRLMVSRELRDRLLVVSAA